MHRSIPIDGVLPICIVSRIDRFSGCEIKKQIRNAHFIQVKTFWSSYCIIIQWVPWFSSSFCFITIRIITGFNYQIPVLIGIQQLNLTLYLLHTKLIVIINTGFSRITPLCGDKYHATSTSRTINGCRSCVFQYINSFNILGIDIYIFWSRISINHIERCCTSWKRVRSTNFNLHSFSRRTTCLHHLYTSDFTD